MKKILSLLLLIPLQSFAFETTPNDLIIKMKYGKTIPLIKEIKSTQNLFENIYVIRTNELAKVETALRKNRDVLTIERNHRSEKRILPSPIPFARINNEPNINIKTVFNDPFLNKVWAFDDASNNGISINSAYLNYGNEPTSPVIVAVVDTGIDYRHEDLKDVVWVNQKEIPGNGIDDDGNGYIDDINGINTLIRDSAGKATSENFDTHSHGTHVAGTIGAKQNNGLGIAGIASNVKIMAIRTVPNDGDETDIDVAEAFIYAARNGARIINCSFGKNSNEGRQLIPDTLKYIGDKYGVLVIAASGNDSTDIDKFPTYPASFTNENLLIVASTTIGGKLSYFSNYGKVNVDVAAPGSNVYSTVPGNKYEYMSGTSMASPTTTGVAAEILSHHPDLTAAELKNLLIRSVTPIDSFKKKMVSGGRIDLEKGLDLAKFKYNR